MTIDRRFRFLVVDDQEDRAGWGRVVEVLTSHGYLPDSWATEDALSPLGLTVVGPGWTRSTFADAVELLRSSYHDYHAIFIDLDLTKNGFLPEGFASKTLNQLATKEHSAYLAGIYLLEFLPMDERPKIFFSGSDTTTDLRRAFDLLGYSRYSDIRVGDIVDTSFKDDIVQQLDRALLRTQRSICARMGFQTRNTICRAVRADAWEETASLSTGVDGWTAEALFPRQFFLQNAKAVLAVLAFDWRSLLRFLLDHPNAAETQRAFEEANGDLSVAVLTAITDDFAVDRRLPYAKVTNLPSFSSDTNRALSLRSELLGFNALWFGASHFVTAQEYLTPLFETAQEVENAIKYCGISPIDLSYVWHVVLHNAHKHFGTVATGIAWRTRTALVVEGSVRPPTTLSREVWREHVLKAQAKIKIERPLRALQDEGLGDICRIICGRYKGVFEIHTPAGGLVARPEADSFSVDLTDNTSEAGSSCRFSIPALDRP